MTKEQTKKQTHRHRGEGGWEEDEEGKRGQIDGDKKKLDFGCWAHNRTYKSIIKLHTKTYIILLINLHQ